MIDIHSHFLPGIDDGAKDHVQSLKMLEQAAEAGITDLVSTPHFNEFVSTDCLDKIDKVFNETNEVIQKNNLNIRIHSASEVLMDTKIFDWVTHKKFLHGKKNNYLLFELPHFFEFNKISENVFKLKLDNITPVLAHPERSPKIQESPNELIHWIQQGCVMQMNAGSILGQFGTRCKNISKKLLDSGLINLIASDAHDPRHRNYLILKEAKEYIIQNYDEEFADILLNKNPANILNSKSVKFFKINSENLKNNKFKNIIKRFRFSPK